MSPGYSLLNGRNDFRRKFKYHTQSVSKIRQFVPKKSEDTGIVISMYIYRIIEDHELTSNVFLKSENYARFSSAAAGVSN